MKMAFETYAGKDGGARKVRNPVAYMETLAKAHAGFIDAVVDKPTPFTRKFMALPVDKRAALLDSFHDLVWGDSFAIYCHLKDIRDVRSVITPAPAWVTKMFTEGVLTDAQKARLAILLGDGNIDHSKLSTRLSRLDFDIETLGWAVILPREPLVTDMARIYEVADAGKPIVFDHDPARIVSTLVSQIPILEGGALETRPVPKLEVSSAVELAKLSDREILGILSIVFGHIRALNEAPAFGTLTVILANMNGILNEIGRSPANAIANYEAILTAGLDDAVMVPLFEGGKLCSEAPLNMKPLVTALGKMDTQSALGTTLFGGQFVGRLLPVAKEMGAK